MNLLEAVQLALPKLIPATAPAEGAPAADAVGDEGGGGAERDARLVFTKGDDTCVTARPSTGGKSVQESLEGSEKSTGIARLVTKSSMSTRGPYRSHFVEKLKDSEALHLPTDAFRRRLLKVVQSGVFETLSGIVIVVYTLILFLHLQFSGLDLDPENGAGAVGESTMFTVLSHAFNVIFIIELLLKLVVYRASFFLSRFNVFDLVIVIITSFDLYVLSQIGNSIDHMPLMRTICMLRLGRVLRILRTLELFGQLRVLMHSIILSFVSTFWSLLILFVFLLVGSLFLTQQLQEYISDASNDFDTRVWVYRYYGTSMKAAYTFFELTFSGCWPTYARRLTEKVSPWWALFFLLYVIFVIFTLIRIIYALLLKDTLEAAASDAEQVVRIKMREQKSLVQKLSELFSEADVSGDGFLSKEEFAKILDYPKVQVWMSTLGLDTRDTEALFQILDDGFDNTADGMVSWEEFSQGIMRMKGHAREQDLICSIRDTHRILKHLETLRCEVAKLAAKNGKEDTEADVFV
uniref:EF-hand domain-containing protein n=1 Tax=Alexandrium monilatum TaxID=311494 RepID=A0A7S4VNA4_9DINO